MLAELATDSNWAENEVDRSGLACDFSLFAFLPLQRQLCALNENRHHDDAKVYPDIRGDNTQRSRGV